ncbi:hypothetical protein HYPSUDRAFT_138406, partial [Hypholoma sublateritium FD-334 SS-4]
TSKLHHISNLASRCHAVGNMFHACMKDILSPLEEAGRDGVVFVSGDGAAHYCHPIFVAYIGDYPEQVLVTLVKSGLCPVCPAACQGIGELESICDPHPIGPILDALDAISEGPGEFARVCLDAGIKPVQEPFWKDLPFANVYRSITPDLLHQLYQGLFKHVVAWIQKACSTAELDARCWCLPPNHHIHLFMKGISNLSRVTGQEHDQISKFLLGLIMDIRLPDGLSNKPLIATVRGMLDFIYLAQYPIPTTQTLDQLNDHIFVTLGIRQAFDFPKLHFMGHYRMFIELYGTADNFNMEYTKHLHINIAKDVYAATNKKDEYSQMTGWLDRCKKMLQHEKYIRRHEDAAHNSQSPHKPPPSLISARHVQMAKHPTCQSVPLDVVRNQYGAHFFNAALARFIIPRLTPEANLTPQQIEAMSHTFDIPFTRIPVFHRLKFTSRDMYSLTPDVQFVMDSLHVKPPHLDKYKKAVPARFDTAVINFNNSGPAGVAGYCVGRIHCIFSIPCRGILHWFPTGPVNIPAHLAYVEWFTPFSCAIFEPNSRLYNIKPLIANGQRQASIIPISLIRQSVHLYPKFSAIAPTEWKSSNVLNLATSFYVNPFSDRFPYTTLF